jgi:hypothetical protein
MTPHVVTSLASITVAFALMIRSGLHKRLLERRHESRCAACGRRLQGGACAACSR